MQYFTYLWIDTSRKMFYIGMHEGSIDDNYTSSSRWFNGEYNYRPTNFKRKVLKIFNDRASARKEEARLLAMIKESEFGSRYYNLKNGRPKGTPASNKGKPMSVEQRQKLSSIAKGRVSPTKGKRTTHSSQNGKKGSAKLSKTATGRRMATRPDGTRYWIYGADCLVDKEQSANPHSITV